MTTDFSFVVPGRPYGKGRPRFAQGRTYTPRETVVAEQAIRGAWEHAGAIRLPDGPVRLEITLGVVRPRSHFKKDGSTSTEGRRHPWPARQKPDVDNALKLIMDSLNGRAYADDVQVVDVHVMRVWADAPFTRVVGRSLSSVSGQWAVAA
jgi:Holliday junction resolvase RusA-like endonuclease